jgi:hypothetical protein
LICCKSSNNKAHKAPPRSTKLLASLVEAYFLLNLFLWITVGGRASKDSTQIQKLNCISKRIHAISISGVYVPAIVTHAPHLASLEEECAGVFVAFDEHTPLVPKVLALRTWH